MRITVRLFAILRDAANGRDAIELSLRDGETVAAALAALTQAFPRVEPLLKRSAVAVNRVYASREDVLVDGDELACIPPVSGG